MLGVPATRILREINNESFVTAARVAPNPPARLSGWIGNAHQAGGCRWLGARHLQSLLPHSWQHARSQRRRAQIKSICWGC
jgi:hypothetical protein